MTKNPNDEALVMYQAMNAYGQVTTQQFGNGISQTRSYDQLTGIVKVFKPLWVTAFPGQCLWLSEQWYFELQCLRFIVLPYLS